MKARDQADRLVYSVCEAGRLLGLGRNAAYQAAKRGDIPTIKVGRRVLVPKEPLHKLVGAEAGGWWMSGAGANDEEEGSEETER